MMLDVRIIRSVRALRTLRSLRTRRQGRAEEPTPSPSLKGGEDRWAMSKEGGGNGGTNKTNRANRANKANRTNWTNWTKSILRSRSFECGAREKKKVIKEKEPKRKL